MRERFALLVGLTISSLMLVADTPASAATPPDSCFAFSSGTGTITNYYDHEGNNSANPACPRDVDIPSTIGGVTVTTIGANSFSDSSGGLTSVVVPATVTNIGNYAFWSDQMTSFTVLGNPATLGSNILSRNKLDVLSYNGTTYTSSQPITEACFEFSAGTITKFHHTDLAYIKSNSVACLNHDLDIPTQIGGVPVTAIGPGVFDSARLDSVSIPDSVVTIGRSAFNGSELPSVTLPSGLASIGKYAFQNNKLTTVAIPGSVTSIEDSAFYGNQLTSVDISDGVSSIGEYVFANNDLTSVIIPGSVASVGSSAFVHNQLTSLDIADGVVSIGESAFHNNDLTSVAIPSSVTTIGQAAFRANQLESVEMAEGLVSIGDSAFSDNKLTTVAIPSTVTSVGSYAFANNLLTGLPEGIDDIPDGVVSNNNIGSIVIPEGVESIGAYAFAGNQLTSVVIPDSVTAMGDGAFQNNLIDTVQVGTGLTSLSPSVFAWQIDFDRFGGDEDAWYDAFYSEDPELFSQARGAVLLPNVYTSDPTNSQGLKSSLAYETYLEIDGDGDWNDVVVIGGYIVNPAHLTLNYHSSTNQSLRMTQQFVGQNTDGSYITNYYLSDMPSLPEPSDTGSYPSPVLTPAEQQAIDDMFAQYYQIGDTVTITPPAIEGYVTPGTQTFTLTSAAVEATIVYVAADSGNMPDDATDGELADTGANLPLIVALACAAMFAGGVLLVRRMVLRA